MTIRKKLIIGLIILAVLIAGGVLIWALKTGKLKPRAEGGCGGHACGQVYGHVYDDTSPDKMGPFTIAYISFNWCLRGTSNCQETYKYLTNDQGDYVDPPIVANPISPVPTNSQGFCRVIVTKPGYKIVPEIFDNQGCNVYAQNPSEPGPSPIVFRVQPYAAPIDPHLSGTVYGQDSDSQTKVSLQLAKASTTINGKVYFTRTDKDGKYTLDFSDQTSLPLTITVTASADTESFDSQDQTLTLSQSNTQDFTLGRERVVKTVEPVFDENMIKTLYGLTNAPVASSNSSLSLLPQAKAIAGANVKVTVRNNDPTNGNPPVANAKVFLLISLDNNGLLQGTTDAKGEAVFNNVNADYALVLAGTTENKFRVDTDFVELKANETVNSDLFFNFYSPSFNGIKFSFVGKKAGDLSRDQNNDNFWQEISAIISQLSLKYERPGFTNDVVIDSTGSLNAFAFSGALVSNMGFKPIISFTAGDFTDPLDADSNLFRKAIPSITAHEWAHTFQLTFLRHSNQIFANIAKAGYTAVPGCTDGQCEDLCDPDMNGGAVSKKCGWILILDAFYTGFGGHPWDSHAEAFASTFAAHEYHFLDFTNALKDTAINNKQKNLGKFSFETITSFLPSTNPKTYPFIHHPINISRVYSINDILNGNF